MILQRIKDTDVYYLSEKGTGRGITLLEGSLSELSAYVENDLINENTPLFAGVEFQDLGTETIQTQVDRWYAIQLENNLYQIILTEQDIKYNLPLGQKWRGSLPELISFLFERLNN